MQDLVAGLVAEVVDVGAARLGDPQADHAKQGDQGVVGAAGVASRDEQRSELQRVQHRPPLPLPFDLRAGDRIRRVGRDVPVDHRVLQERCDGAEAAGDRGRRVVGRFQCADVELELPSGDPEGVDINLGASRR